MRNIIQKIISVSMSLTLLSLNLFASSSSDPYSFYPTEMHKPKGELFTPVKDLIERNPIRPLVITDKSGNKMYTTSDGMIMVTVDNSGNRTFSIRGRKSHQIDSKGKLIKKWERKAGSDMIVMKNENNEVLGMDKMGRGGKTVASYDADGNKIRSYKYDKYGKRIEWVIDELSQTKIKYDDKGKAVYDVDALGNKIATYSYDGDGRLQYKTDIYGNVTTFDKKGNRQKTVAKDGYVMATYNYRKDRNGYYQLQSVKDEMAKSITLYEDGKQKETRNFQGVVVKTYKWQGTKLVYSEDHKDETITWYDNSRPTYATRHGELVMEWMYHEGKTLGLWEADKQTVRLYSHGEVAYVMAFSRKPTEEELLEIYKDRGFSL